MKRLQAITVGIGLLTCFFGVIGLIYICILLFAPPDILRKLAEVPFLHLVPFMPSSISVVQSAGGVGYFVTRPGPAIVVCVLGLIVFTVGLVRWNLHPTMTAKVGVWLGASLIFFSNYLSPLISFWSALLLTTGFAIITSILIAAQPIRIID